MTEKSFDIRKPVDVNRPIKTRCYIIAIIATLGASSFGYDIGGSGGTFVMKGFRSYFGWPPLPGQNESEEPWVSDLQGWIALTFPLGALVGSLPSGYMADRWGRKRTIQIFCGVFIFGTVLQTASVHMAMLLVGRVFAGMGIGVKSCVVTMYLSEMSPYRIRGVMITVFQLCITFGIVLAAALNVGLKYWDAGWRLSYGGNLIFAVPMFFLLFTVPESPRFLVMHNRLEEARSALQETRYEDEVEGEVQEIMQNVAADGAEEEMSWMELFSSKNRQGYRTIEGVLLQFFQQWTGINAIMYFAPVMFSQFFDETTAIVGNLVVMIVNFLATFICIFTIEKYGRRFLLISGGVGMAVFTFAVAMSSAPFSDYTNPDNVGIGVLIIVFCCLYVICFAYSWGPVVWVLCAEIQSTRARGKAMSLSTAVNWGINACVGKLTPILYRPDAFNLYGTFLFFMAWNIILTAYCCVYVPETKGISLEELDDMYMEFQPGCKHKEFIPKSERQEVELA